MIRLQRFLAQAGIASRRKCEELIATGRVTVNGKVADELGTKIDPQTDRVAVDGKRVQPQDHIWLVLHKPPQTICSTSDPEGRQTVMDLIRMRGVRLFPVGRLDYPTSGVLLITNDGDLAERMLHPKNELPRTYHVKIRGPVSVAELERLREGVIIDTGQKVRADVSLLASTGLHTWVEMTIRQGINHQIHRMWDVLERKVLRLIRVEFGGIRADNLPPGKYRALTQREVTELRNRFGLKGETRRDTESKASRGRGKEGPRRSGSARVPRGSAQPPRKRDGGAQPPRKKDSGGTKPPRKRDSGGTKPPRKKDSGGTKPPRKKDSGGTKPPRNKDRRARRP